LAFPGGGGAGYLAVDVSAVADANNAHNKFVVLDQVNDSVLAASQSIFLIA
jgi:hypothetical protein